MKKSKYKAIKTCVNGIEFDSRKEARRYQELLLLERGKAISNLMLQVKFVLIPAQYEEVERYGKKGNKLKNHRRLVEKEVSYIADFVYEEDGKLIVEDTKGFKTKDYIIKRKLMLYEKGIKIREG